MHAFFITIIINVNHGSRHVTGQVYGGRFHGLCRRHGMGEAARLRQSNGRGLVLKSVEHSSALSPLSSASYLETSVVEMVRYGTYSADNGRTWLT